MIIFIFLQLSTNLSPTANCKNKRTMKNKEISIHVYYLTSVVLLKLIMRLYEFVNNIKQWNQYCTVFCFGCGLHNLTMYIFKFGLYLHTGLVTSRTTYIAFNRLALYCVWCKLKFTLNTTQSWNHSAFKFQWQSCIIDTHTIFHKNKIFTRC